MMFSRESFLSVFVTLLLCSICFSQEKQTTVYFHLHKLELKETWGSSGSGKGMMDKPHGIAVAPDGHIFVADTGNHRIQEFDSSGKVVRQFGSEGNSKGQFNKPVDLVLSPQRHILVLEKLNNRIQKFDSNGKFLRFYNGPLNEPNSVALDSKGNLLIADTYNHRLVKFSSEGKFLFSVGSGSGKADGQFNEPRGVAVNHLDEIYVTDRMNYRVQKFSADGEFIKKWGREGTLPGAFLFPYGIAIASDGSVYVIDQKNNRFQKFDTNGKFLGQWKLEKAPGEDYLYPFCLDVDSFGNVYLTSYSGRIRKYSPSAYLWSGKKHVIEGKITGAKRKVNKSLKVLITGKDRKRNEFFALCDVSKKGEFAIVGFPAKATFTLKIIGLEENGYQWEKEKIQGKSKKKLQSYRIELQKKGK